MSVLLPQATAAKPIRETPVALENIDPAAFAEWAGGSEKSLAGEDRSSQPQWVLWTTQTNPGHSGLKFGDTTLPGVRHLRIGFKQAVPVGSVFVSAGGQLSVLRPDAAYPGDLANDADWLPAERLEKGEVSHSDVGRKTFAVWGLPPHTQTRALRFTHKAEASESSYAGYLGAALVVSERLTNLAPQALTGASAQAQNSGHLNNGEGGLGHAWHNFDEPVSDAEIADLREVSPSNAPWVMLHWPKPVRIDGLNLLDTGFTAAEVQVFSGPDDLHPRDAGESAWRAVGNYEGIETGYPVPLWSNRLQFSEPVTTRAVRLRITAPNGMKGLHPHVVNKSRNGKRVWLGEMMALQALGNEPLRAPDAQRVSEALHAPIPVRFKLEKAGFVTLVVEDPAGKRVRNLISETPFPAGENTAWWDGTDDLGRDVDAARHGVYKIPSQFVAPGSYRIRGLVRDEIVPRYEFPIYTGGSPAWETADKAGGWLTNHTPPQAALFVSGGNSPTGSPMVYLGSAVSEGGAGLAWVDEGGKKIGGRGWIGGNWTAAPFLAKDTSPRADAQVYAYVGATWTASADNREKTHGELRITALTTKGDRAVIKHPFTPPGNGEDDHHWIEQLGGIAAYDGLVVASMNKLGSLLFIDATSGGLVAEQAVEKPRGLVFDRDGRLLVLSGTKLQRWAFDPTNRTKVSKVQTLVSTGLEDPCGITIGDNGDIFISDQGASNQVKVFSSEGKHLRDYGRAGIPKAGPYDPLHMNHPAGLALDSNKRLWVAENDYLPKRVSVWNPDGTLWKAFYGPAKYGGGGTLDPRDRNRFFYADEGRGAMEFTLDWNKGGFELARVYYRRGPESLVLPSRQAAPEFALYHSGKRYFANCYNSNPTGGATAFLFMESNGIARPVAGMGRAAEWDLLKTEAFASRIPSGADWKKKPPLFLWSDTNEDGKVQPEEVTFYPAACGGITVMPDLSLCAARVGEQAMRFSPVSFTKGGVPIYDFAKGETLAAGVQGPASSGGDQALASRDGWSVVTLGIAPFSKQSLSGAYKGEARWSYPSAWPGLHAAHEAPVPDRPGQLIGTTRLLGGMLTPKGSDIGEIWAVNANLGTIYLFSADGLFIATVFEDKRSGKSWSMPAPERNMSLKGFSIGEENFWPTWSQSPDGSVYVMDGAHASLVRLDGLESIRRLPDTSLEVRVEDLKRAASFIAEREAARQQTQGRGVLELAVRAAAPAVDGDIKEWSDASWVDIDKSGVRANFNSNSKPYDYRAALAIAGDRLYAAFRTADEKLLQNSGEVANAPFKTGGCLDLMLGLDPDANPARSAPVEGDIRLLVTRVKGAVRAVLYRAVVPGTAEPVLFSSPVHSITLDRVEDVSSEVELAGSGGNYEFSIPLSVLKLSIKPGQSLTGDIGILRGDGIGTSARVYWSNKATGITSDVPSEAMLTPRLWGKIEPRAR